jgi:limonene-1,2-epoxide hydrolase
MGTKQEEIVRTFMAAWGDGSQEFPDIPLIMSMFADDAVWQLWVPGGPTLRGVDAIRRDIERQTTWAKFMRCGAIHIASAPDSGIVFTERTDNFVTNGVTIVHQLVAIFEVDTDGKISAWREYFDTKDIDRQLATTKVVVPKVAKD